MIFLLVWSLEVAFSDQETKSPINVLNINKKEIIKISSYASIIRDKYFKKNLNKIIIARGYVELVVKKNFFKKQYRISIIDNTPSKKIHLRYHVYTSNKDYSVILKKGDIFELRGQFVMYTPLNSKRNSYIIVVILEEGAVVVE